MLLSACDTGHAENNFRHVVRGADRLRGDGQRWIDGGGRWKKGRIHHKQIFMVERSAEFTQSSFARIVSKAHRTALVGDGEASHVLRDIELETDLFHQ